MSMQRAFLKALAADEDDDATRLVYADWLDDHGEHEEADRHRRWPAAKTWLVKFCESNARASYADLLEFGHKAVQEAAKERTYLDNEDLWHALEVHGQKFWMYWSIVTGVPLPPSFENKDFHRWECCPHDISYWFGLPSANE